MSPHPTELELDSFRDGRGDEPIAGHLGQCADCRALLETLRALAAPPPAAEVPATIDALMIEAARAAGQRIASRRRRRSIFVAAAGTLAAAAAALFFLWHAPPAPPPRVAGVHDVNQDGKLDILDAFSMARAIEAGQPTRREWDLTGDGVVDRADIDALARAAVSVGGGG